MAGTDCGFGTWAGFGPIDPTICWAKLATMAEGPGVVWLGDESVALACEAGLRGTALPSDWPTPEELGVPDYLAMDAQ